MKTCSVQPSNYTLSMLVKLMCRCRRLDQAFTVLGDISREYKFKINIQVYTCLIQGCFHNGQVDKAMTVYNTIMKEGLLPDAMTYSVLIRGFLRSGSIEKAAELLRHAHGVGAESCPQVKMPQFPTVSNQEAALLKAYGDGKNAAPGVNAGRVDEVVSALGGTNSKEASKLLADIRHWSPTSISNARAGKQK